MSDSYTKVGSIRDQTSCYVSIHAEEMCQQKSKWQELFWDSIIEDDNSIYVFILYQYLTVQKGHSFLFLLLISLTLVYYSA